MSGKKVTSIKVKYCPFCEEKHLVEYIGACLMQRIDNKRLKVYKCPQRNKEFRLLEDQ